MPNFAIHDGSTVINVIVAESQVVAEEVSGLSAVETVGKPWIGWTLDEYGWKTSQESPFPSWSWNYETMAYTAPDPYPGNGYAWDEDALAWVSYFPYPDDGNSYVWDSTTQSWVAVP